MKRSWDGFTIVVWLPAFVVLTEAFGDGGSIIALLLLPLAWILWVNLREHWWRAEDRDAD